MSFARFGLNAEILRAIESQGYKSPTEIQNQAIEIILAGNDMLAGSQTGTGKTAAFALPILERLSVDTERTKKSGRKPRALVLTPTRELAAQVCESFRTYGQYGNLKSVEIFGGVSIGPQRDKLKRGTDILVATPGRLLDHLGQNKTLLSEVQTFVLDEADRMLDMGFIHDIKKVLAVLPGKRQNLMFSATYSPEIKKLAKAFLDKPAVVEVSKGNSAAKSVEQLVYKVEKSHKRHLLRHLIEEGRWHQVLVFTRTKHGANRLAQQLSKAKIETAAIHGNKSQGARTTALANFKSGKVCVLVATDIAARGIDIEELPYVVNYDLPNVPEDYVHRIGRTGRAGESGIAISLVDASEAKYLNDIQKLLGHKLPIGEAGEFFIPASNPNQEHSPANRAKKPQQKPARSAQDGRGNQNRQSRSKKPNNSQRNRAV